MYEMELRRLVMDDDCWFVYAGLSTSFSIAKEGIQAAYLANQVNKEREKRRKDVQEQR
jgi:hypothetical protein